MRSLRLAVLSLVAIVGLLAADGVWAQRTCELPAELTGRTCSVATCIVLQDAVDAACKPKPKACVSVVGCFNLRARRQQFLDCYVARSTINVSCWSGGNLNHQAEAAYAIEQVYVCEARIALPEPVGCADPCPFDFIAAVTLDEVRATAASDSRKRADEPQPAESESSEGASSESR